MNKKSLIGMTQTEISSLVAELKLPSFTAKQITKWCYQKRIFDISKMTDLSKTARTALEEQLISGTHSPVKVSESRDGTKKYLFAGPDGKFIESAYIPDQDRATLCVSTQVGCKMGCLFCMTARQGFQGHLSASEILNQIVSIPESDKLTNVVFMGMGEPFDNLESVLQTLTILTSDWGFAWSPKRVTVSTIGVIPGLKRFLAESECHLAVSLHSPFHEERKSLMPIENVYPLPELLKVIHDFDFGNQRRITFEYILFDGINDSDRHIKELCKILHGLHCRINLLHYHQIPGSSLKPSPKERLISFRDELTKKGFIATVRASRGEDIFAACGLLSTRELNKRPSDDE
jgi:23S rRNA (adenine2503-C2)-methyltransferase